MTMFAPTLARVRTVHSPSHLWLSGLFLAFCYSLLSWRALLLDQRAPLFSEHRLVVLLIGAGLFWLSIERIDRVGRVTLARIASWIVAATATVLLVRTALDWLLPAGSRQFRYDLRWSLAWGGYFGMWVMGTITFRRRHAFSTGTASDTATVACTPAADIDWLVDALAAELAALSPGQREELAGGVLGQAGAYEIADDRDPFAAAHNARMALAARFADRLQH